MEVFAECYANKVLAYTIKEKLPEIKRVIHKEYFGRDRIVKEAIEISKSIPDNEYLLIIIDYEEGLFRIYIDKNFRFFNSINDKIKIATYHEGKIIAIIFDPRIEEALIYRLDNSLRRLEKRIKSKKAEKILPDVLNNNEAKKIINMMVDKIKEAITVSLQHK